MRGLCELNCVTSSDLDPDPMAPYAPSGNEDKIAADRFGGQEEEKTWPDSR